MVRARHALAAAAVIAVASPVAWNLAREREAVDSVPLPKPVPDAGVAPVPGESVLAPPSQPPLALPPSSQWVPATPKTVTGQALGSSSGQVTGSEVGAQYRLNQGYGFDAGSQRGSSELPVPTAPLVGAPVGKGTSIPRDQRQAFRFSGGARFDSGPAPVLPPPRTRTSEYPVPGSAPEGRVWPAEPIGRDSFAGASEVGFKAVREDPVSTFSIDVDTASYAFVRASLNRNILPPKAAVRTEELINYFPYDYAGPVSAAEPFTVTTAVYPSPWAEGRKIVRVGIKGYAVAPATRPAANLVFLVDTSGSMSGPNRLPLVKQSLAMLLTRLDGRDRVAIITYAGGAGTVIEPTPADQTAKILGAIEGLSAGGGTAGGEGIRQAYALAERNLDPQAVNRVVLATDGDFNVGITSRDELKDFVERERAKGIFLSVLGFGMGNYGDALMQALAQNGNGAAAYIDTLNEARKVLVEEATSTLIPIAKDVKIQVEFNPAAVSEYRLIGYETRMLGRQDFANDKVDAGDVGSGQGVTALYEIIPLGGPGLTGNLRYGTPVPRANELAGEYAHVAIRYKLPKADASTLITTTIDHTREIARFEDAPQEARFATAVAAFGQILRGGRYTGTLGLDDVARMAIAAKGDDPFGYRSEFVQLVRAAKTAQGLVAPQ